MKKALLTMLILMTIIPYAFSAENQIYIMPKNGAFGVYLGSEKYTGGDEYTEGSLDSIGANSGKYVGDMIVATVTIGEIPVDTPFPINVRFSVDCPDGLYFVSQQGEGSRRPFELQVIPKIRTSYEKINRTGIWSEEPSGEYKDDDNGVEKADKIVLSDNIHSSDTIVFDKKPEPSEAVPEEWYYDFPMERRWEPRYHVLIFDVILVLPYSALVTSTGILSTPSGDYQLVQADDYTALVTLTVDYNGTPQSVTIPFSGYFSLNESAKREGTANLYVNPTAAAANLSIENDWGRAKNIASVNFLATYDSSVAADYRVFLSAINDPTVESRYGFELVHEDVTPLQPHTNNNSIGYTLELSGTAGSYNPTIPVEFDGYAHIDGNAIKDKDGVDRSVAVNSREIYEDYRTNKYLNEEYKDNPNDSRNYKAPVVYEYEGDINIIIDEPVDINAMMPGRYYSDIYVHVVDLGA